MTTMTTATEPREHTTKPAAEAAVHLALAAMGTRFELVLPRTDRNPPERQLRAAGEAALAEIEEAHRRYSMHSRDSTIARINREAARKPVVVDGEVFDLLALCARMHEQSGGAFDPTASSPSLAGWSAVELDPGRRTVFFHAPDLTIDLGGVAKGFALDLAADVLDEAGIRDALLHGGGSSILALGTPGHGTPGWPVHLDDNRRETITLSNQVFAIAERHARDAERRRSPDPHIAPDAHGDADENRIDRALCILPAIPANHAAAICDAWATALVAAGRPIDPAPPGTRTAVGAQLGWRWTDGAKPPTLPHSNVQTTTESRR